MLADGLFAQTKGYNESNIPVYGPGTCQYCKISKNSEVGDLLTSHDLIMEIICMIDLLSERAPTFKHFEWSYDLLPSETRVLRSILIIRGMKFSLSIFFTSLVFCCSRNVNMECSKC